MTKCIFTIGNINQIVCSYRIHFTYARQFSVDKYQMSQHFAEDKNYVKEMVLPRNIVVIAVCWLALQNIAQQRLLLLLLFLCDWQMQLLEMEVFLQQRNPRRRGH